MPYIDANLRKEIDGFIQKITQYGSIYLSGELNYIITKILLSNEPKSYTDFNKLIGVLECVKLELYRRAVAPYEDIKKLENGDVYD